MNHDSANLFKSTPGVFAQVYSYSGKKGDLFVVFTTGTKLDPEEFKNQYFNSLGTAFAAFKQAFAEFASQLPRDINIGAIAIVDDAVYITGIGNMSVILERDSKEIPIFTPTVERISTLSGKVRPGDKLVFGKKDLTLDWGSVSSEPILNEDQEVAKSGLLVGILDKAIKILPQKGLRVHPEEDVQATRRKKLTMFLGLGLFLVLLISIFFGAKRKTFLDQTKFYDEKLSTANQQLEEARSLKDLSQDRARTLLLGARDIALELESVNSEDNRLKALKSSIEESLGEIAGLYKSQANLYLDLSLISNNFEAGKVDYSEGNLLVLDKEGERLVSIDLPSKKTEVTAGPSELNNATDVAAYTEREFVLESDGIKEIGNGNKTVVPKDWSGEVLIKSFAGNMYVLDKSANAIWRYSGDGINFGAKSPWLAEGQTYQLDDSEQWMIDGSVWVLDQGGKISKYISGRLDSFALNQSGDYENFYTDADAEYLYVLDNSAGMVHIFDKKGQFKGEYDAPEIKDATSIVVSEPEKKMLLFAGNKIYEIELKHI